MPNMKTIKEIKTKVDAKNPRPTIPIGMSCEVKFYQKDGLEMMEVQAPNGAVWNVPTAKMIKFFKKLPSMNSLEKWSSDGISRSVTGQTVEPDGHGIDGSPSWLLVFNLI